MIINRVVYRQHRPAWLAGVTGSYPALVRDSFGLSRIGCGGRCGVGVGIALSPPVVGLETA